MAPEVVALAFCPASVAAVALVSVPLVVALGAVVLASLPLVVASGAVMLASLPLVVASGVVVLASLPLVVALGDELEVDGWLDMVDEVSPAVPDGMLLLEAPASGCAVDELEVLDWA